MFNNIFHEDILPDVQTELPLEQLEAIPSCLVTGGQGEEASPHPATASFHMIAEDDNVPQAFFFAG